MRDPIKQAEAHGHKLVNDPPANTLSSMNRKTCSICGACVLWNSSTAYGSALEADCTRPVHNVIR
jgi:hypothetical protein